MQVHQVVIRPHVNQVIVLFEDGIGTKDSVVFDSTGNAAVASLLAECQGRLPSPSENPARTEIERQISELQKRIASLKQSIGQPV